MIGELVNWWVGELASRGYRRASKSTRGSACDVNSPIHQFTNSPIEETVSTIRP
jgi:hypothetical protein